MQAGLLPREGLLPLLLLLLWILRLLLLLWLPRLLLLLLLLLLQRASWGGWQAAHFPGQHLGASCGLLLRLLLHLLLLLHWLAKAIAARLLHQSLVSWHLCDRESASQGPLVLLVLPVIMRHQQARLLIVLLVLLLVHRRWHQLLPIMLRLVLLLVQSMRGAKAASCRRGSCCR